MAAQDVQAEPNIPPHVPRHLIYDYDFFSAPTKSQTPQWDIAKKLLAEAPPIFYTPRNGGHWVVTRPLDTVRMFRNWEVFSSDPQYHPVKAENPTRHLPLFYDPPEHTDARKIVAPHFTPAAMTAFEPTIRRLAIELIEGVIPEGRCDFARDIGQVLPVAIFFELAKLSMKDRPMLQGYIGDYMRSPDGDVRLTGMRSVVNYIQAVVEDRRKTPGDDIISKIIHAPFMGRELTPMEALSAANTILIAGLDTVAALISCIMAFLARNPGHYRQIAANPELIPTALEELIRVSSNVMPERACTRDAVVDGITYKKHDRVVFLLQVQGMTDDRFEDPYAVNFDRGLCPHITFGAGHHRCVGSHLARLELKIFMEEWVRRISEFHIVDNQDIHFEGGTIWAPKSLPLAFSIVK